MIGRILSGAALAVSLSYGCGCVDAGVAVTATKAMNFNYAQADRNLANALARLGEAVRRGYDANGDAALETERVLRLRKEQAFILQSVSFHAEKAVSAGAVRNTIVAKSVETNLGNAEKNAILEAAILNKAAAWGE